MWFSDVFGVQARGEDKMARGSADRSSEFIKKKKTKKNAFVADPNPCLFAATTQADRKIETVLFKLFKS